MTPKKNGFLIGWKWGISWGQGSDPVFPQGLDPGQALALEQHNLFEIVNTSIFSDIRP